MRLTDIQVDGFGVLSGLRFEDLAPGLNVIHGPNGSGKTTLLHFIRGVWSGFDDARRLRLLPPLSGGHPGGTLGLAGQDRSYRLTRQALPNQSDRVAIAIRRGGFDDSATVRGLFESIDPELVHRLFAVTAAEAHAVEPLLRMAARDGIALTSKRRPSTRFDSRLAEVRRRRALLLGGAGEMGETQSLRDDANAAAGELSRLQAEADRLRDQLSERYSELFAEIERLARRIEWLDLERQARESDIREAQDRSQLQSHTPPRKVVVVACRPTDELHSRIAEIDRRIAHARTVLEDLARNRMQVSLQTAQVAGIEAIDAAGILSQQRELIGTFEQELLRLRELTQSVSQTGACRCSELTTQISSFVGRLQQPLYLLCQQLARQDQFQRQWQLSTERSHVDRCEAELQSHLARLERERSQLLRDVPDAGWARLQNPSSLETAGCECHEHQSYLNRTSGAVRVEVAPAPPVEPRRSDPRLPEWIQRRAALDRELDETRRAWREARGLCAEWDAERSRLVVLERRIAEQQIEVEVRQQQLASRLAEGQALIVVEAGLERMRETVLEDESAQVIAEASGYLREMTAGRYQGLQFSVETGELAAVTDSGVPMPLHTLSRGTLDQAALSLRIALSDEYARRGVGLPLILDDVMADCDPDRLDVAIHILQSVGERRQIIYMTCQEHLAARFEAAGQLVLDFPGSRRTRRAPMTVRPPAAAEASPAGTAEPSPPDHSVVTLRPAHLGLVGSGERTRELSTDGVNLSFLTGRSDASVHPSEPHWLRVSSPVAAIPSVGEQMARRLAAAGVRSIGDLVALDPEETELPLSSLQITPAQWRIWQAEGRLLCCVPHLTGRDVQLLVAAGILVPQELAQEDPERLVRKIDRLRGDGRSGWVLAGFVWPDLNTVNRWIRHGQQARSWRSACESIGWGSSGVGTTAAPTDEGRGPRQGDRSRGRHFRIDQPSSVRGPVRRGRFGQRGRATRALIREAQSSRQEPQSSTENSWQAQRSPLPSSASQFGTSSSQRDSASPGRAALRFFLELQSGVVDAPSIGPTTARRLEKIGILTVADLLNRDPQQIADRLAHRRINADMIRDWQCQSRLMCRIPELRGHDAQVLVACGLTDPEAIARMSPQALFAMVGPFVATKEGQRMLRSAKSPDLAEVTDWITWSQQSRTLKAA